MNATWSTGLTTGFTNIDVEHYDFLARAQRVIDGNEGARSVDSALKLLHYLESFVLHHFIEEEQLMLHVDYPDMLAHRAEHGRLAQYIVEARGHLWSHATDLDELALSNRLLCTWLLAHHNTTDRDLSEYIQRNAKPARSLPM